MSERPLSLCWVGRCQGCAEPVAVCDAKEYPEQPQYGEFANLDVTKEDWVLRTRCRCKEFATKYRTSLLSPSTQGGWMPMDSAPKDGSCFLAAAEVWHEGEFSHWDKHIIATAEDGECCTGGIADDFYQGWDWDQYTYWQPLPVDPNATPPALDRVMDDPVFLRKALDQAKRFAEANMAEYGIEAHDIESSDPEFAAYLRAKEGSK